ncbi:MAG: pilus assembly PilX N-terminal domain-containing protein [Desulfobacterales bacterium]|nr:pilus assembly PilX N-terminal domain-containing protein [Desulfobacterales bacterium]
MNRIPIFLKDEKGIALVVALLFLTLLSLLGIAGIITSTTDTKIAGNTLSSTKAFYIAEAGLARAEAELINDLSTDQNIANSSFTATSGDITITPSSTAFYTVFSNISFGAGSYTIQFKNYGTAPNYESAIVLVRSTGTGPNSSTITLERYLSAENISPWNNAIFAGGGGGAAPITGNVIIAGSIHLLGNGLAATDTVFNNQTGDCRNSNTGMDATLAGKIAGGTTSDLNAKFRVKNGRADMTLGSGTIGTSASPFKGIYVTTGTDAGSDGVNDDILGGDNSGAGQNLYADKGANSAEAYDLGDYNITLPSIDTTWMDAHSKNLTGTNQYVGPAGNQKGLIAGALELTGDYKVTGTDYYPNIEQYDGVDWASSTNGIRYNSVTNVLEIKGIVKVTSLNISDDITYAGKGTIYVTGTTNIDGNVLPATAASYPTTNVLGVVSTGNMALPSSSQKLLTGAFYSAGTVTSSKQNELAGTIVCQNFNITAQVPKIWQVPSLATNLPPGMPGSTPVWVFTEKTWREITQD